MSSEMDWESAAEEELARRLNRMGMEGERALQLRQRVEAIARERGSLTVSVADLDETRSRSMGGGPRETPQADPQLEWDADAQRNLEKETIYLRERLRQRIETFARESGQTKITLNIALQVRQMPSGMAAMRAGQAAPLQMPT